MPQATINRDEITDHVTGVEEVAALLVAEVDRIRHAGDTARMVAQAAGQD